MALYWRAEQISVKGAIALVKTKGVRLPIGPPEDRMLRALATYHYLIPEQICTLYYKNSTNYVREKLNKLSDLDYCIRIYLPRLARRGRPRCVYTLGTKGAGYLESVGVDIVGKVRAREEEQRSYLHLSHTI